MSDHPVKDPKKDWVGQRSFGFRNLIPAAPVLLVKDTPKSEKRIVSVEQNTWVPGVGRLTPRGEEGLREVAIWFENKSQTEKPVRTVDQSDLGIVGIPEDDDEPGPRRAASKNIIAAMGIPAGSLFDRQIDVYYRGGAFHRRPLVRTHGPLAGTGGEQPLDTLSDSSDQYSSEEEDESHDLPAKPAAENLPAASADNKAVDKTPMRRKAMMATAPTASADIAPVKTTPLSLTKEMVVNGNSANGLSHGQPRKMRRNYKVRNYSAYDD